MYKKFKYFGQLLRKSDDKKINLILLKSLSSKIAQFYRFFGWCFDRDFQMTEHLKIRDGNVPPTRRQSLPENGNECYDGRFRRFDGGKNTHVIR